MTDEQIVEAAKSAEKKTEFGELVHSKVSRGVNSAYGIGFLEGAEWAREQMTKEAVGVQVVGEQRDLRLIDSTQRCLFNAKRGDWLKIIIVKEN